MKVKDRVRELQQCKKLSEDIKKYSSEIKKSIADKISEENLAKDLIESFEKELFNTGSPADRIADIIMQPKEWELYASAIRDKERGFFNTNTYKNWKTIIDNEFGIDVSIYPIYSSSSRYSNSGYLVACDNIFVGFRARVTLKDE